MEAAPCTARLAPDPSGPPIYNRSFAEGRPLRANKKAFQIEITHETNVNVHCSTGFFLAVAKPAFTGLSSGYTVVVGGIPVSLEELRSGKDQDGSGVNLVLKFSPASATVHIHNTQRMIQIQGGAAIWFLENYLKEKIVDQS